MAYCESCEYVRNLRKQVVLLTDKGISFECLTDCLHDNKSKTHYIWKFNIYKLDHENHVTSWWTVRASPLLDANEADIVWQDHPRNDAKGPGKPKHHVGQRRRPHTRSSDVPAILLSTTEHRMSLVLTFLTV